MDWSLSELGSTVVEIFFNFIFDLINGALQPFLTFIFKFLTEPVNLGAFEEVWASIIYVLSMFYGLLIVLIGLKFIVSGESPEQRESAKSSLRNIIIMIILVQASFLLYELIIGISSSLTQAVLNMIRDNFFIITIDSYSNFGFELILSIIYLIHLIIVLIILLLRYICVSVGVIFFAIGIFFYFISFLNSYGRLILNTLGVLIFIPFFYSLILLTASKLVVLNSFVSYKTLIMIGALDLIILSTGLLLIFVIVKAAINVISPVSKVAKVVKSIT